MTDAEHREPSDLPHLLVEAEGQPPREIPLVRELAIGRADDNDLKLLDPKVSRHHACIAREGPRFVVTDLGSANGTSVDGVRLTCPHYLRHGERILIGDVELVFHEPAQATDATLIAPIPPIVAQAARSAEPARAPAQGASRRGMAGPTAAIVVAGAVLLLALAVVGAYLLAPGLFGREKETAVPTALAAASATAPATATPLATDTPAPTQAPTAVVNPIDPQELEERLTEAHALVLRSNPEQAISIFEDLSSRAPSEAGPEIGWAWALILDDEPDEALPHAVTASTLAPDGVDAAVVLARAHADLGNKAEALAHAQRAVKLGTNVAAAHAVLAEALRINERYTEAADQADLALVQDINNADAHHARGWIYFLADQDVGRAMSELHIAAGLQTELWLRRHELGELLFEGENYTTAIIAFQDALNLRPKAVTYTGIGEAYYALGQYDQARVSLQQAVSADTDDAKPYALLASTYTRLGRCDDARPYANDALALDASNALALEVQAACQAGAPPPTAIPTAVAELVPTPVVTPKPTRAALASPVSGRIAFPVWNNETNTYDVYIANADGTGRRRVIEGFDQPAFSADGKWLAVRGKKPDMRNLFVLRLSDGSIKKVTENVEDNSPSWSPEGGRLVFASTKDRPGHPKAIYVIDPVRLEGSRIVDGRRVDSGVGPVQGESPIWMPDGRLVYKGCDYTVQPMSCGIFIINSGGGPFTQLTRQEQDAAPVGHSGRIAFMSNRDGNWEIYHIRDDAGHLRRLTNNASVDGLPVWSPDGKTIAFVSNQGGPWAVWAMNPDGSGRRKLFDIGGGGLDANWASQRLSWVP